MHITALKATFRIGCASSAYVSIRQHTSAYVSILILYGYNSSESDVPDWLRLSFPRCAHSTN